MTSQADKKSLQTLQAEYALDSFTISKRIDKITEAALISGMSAIAVPTVCRILDNPWAAVVGYLALIGCLMLCLFLDFKRGRLTRERNERYLALIAAIQECSVPLYDPAPRRGRTRRYRNAAE